MGIWKFLGLMVLAAAVLSCLPEDLEVKGIPAIPAKIVVSTHLVPGESLLVLLTKSFSALDAEDDSNPEVVIAQVAVTDAVVEIQGPVDSFVLQNLGNGFYGGVDINFDEGDVYDLFVTSETLGKVSARTGVQKMVDFESLEASLAFNGYDDTLVQVTYKAIDPPLEKNQYILSVQRIRRNNLVNNLLDPNAFTKLVTDEEFDGKEFGETFKAWPRNYKPGDTLAITMTNVSEQYYRFLLMRQENRFSFTQFLGEPINYPTNVEGGLGYFNLNQPAVRLMVLE